MVTHVRFKPTGKSTYSQPGRLKSGKILTSLDGNTWEVASTFTNLANTDVNKTINFNIENVQ